MSKKSKSKRSSATPSSVASSLLEQILKQNAARHLATKKAVAAHQAARSKKLLAIEDRRTFHPSKKQRSARSFNAAHHTLKVKRGPNGKPLSSKISFGNPKRVLICVRRKIRREIIFAFGKGNKGARSVRRRSYFSSISC